MSFLGRGVPRSDDNSNRQQRADTMDTMTTVVITEAGRAVLTAGRPAGPAAPAAPRPEGVEVTLRPEEARMAMRALCRWLDEDDGMDAGERRSMGRAARKMSAALAAMQPETEGEEI